MSENKRSRFDLCIIGCGAGGYAAAMRARDLGRHVCVIESGQIGGAEVKWGALASKTFWELAKDYAIAAKTDRGYKAAGLSVDFAALKRTVIRAVREKQQQMRAQIDAYSPERWPGPGSITFKKGMGSFTGPNRLRIVSRHKSVENIEATYVLIATGSSPRRLEHVPVDQRQILDTDGVLNLKSFPPRLMIVGAGIAGCEYATIFSNFGQSRVYLIDHMQRILPEEDDDVSLFVSRNLAAKGVRIIHSARLQSVTGKSGELVASLELADGRRKRVTVDALLFSIGRTPNLAGLDLAKANLQPLDRGVLPVDAHCRVHRHIYAAGDVTAHPNLVNIAEMEGRYAVRHMFNVRQRPLSYRNMSTVMFFYPAVAAVGLNEKLCREQKIPYRVAYYGNALLPRAIAMRALNGFVKIIVSEDRGQRILGMRAGGPQVSNTIMSIAVLIEQNKGIQNMLRLVYPHPTMSEGIQECLRLLQGESLYKPQTFPEHIRIRTWHPEKGFDPKR